MDKLNVVFLFYARPHLGGSGIMSLELAKELARRGHQVDIVSYPGTHITKEEEELGLRLHPVRDIDYPCFKAEPYDATLASKIANLHAKEGRPVDVIHANYAITHGDAALKARGIIRSRGGNPNVVITSHGSDIHTNGHHDLLSPSLEFTLNSADAMTFVSKALREEAHRLFKLTSEGDVIYNFVDETKFRPPSETERDEIRRYLEIPKNVFVIYHGSNFRPVKNTGLLVEAARVLQTDGYSDVYFVMVGNGPERKEMEERAREYGVSHTMRFVGTQDNVRPYIYASDLSVLCSRRESFGLVLLEAMACGVPSLGSITGGIPEVITDGETGYLFPEGDVQNMVSRIKEFVDQPRLRQEFGQEATRIARTKFNRSTVVDQYINIYRNPTA